jgi:hypothetical protein
MSSKKEVEFLKKMFATFAKAAIQSGRSNRVVVLLLLLIGVGLKAQDTSAVAPRPSKMPTERWSEYKSFDGKFLVMSPGGKMIEKLDTAKTPMGPIAYHLYYNQPDFDGAENYFYMVSYCDYPEGSVHSDSTELVQQLFTETIKEAAFSIAGKVLYQDDIKFLGYPGKLWRIDYGRGKYTIKTRAYVIGNRFYTIQTVMSRLMSLNPLSDRFLDSFKLL